MIKNDVSRIVTQSINDYAKGDTISKTELEAILTDVLTRFGESSFLLNRIDGKLSDKRRLERNMQGLR